MQLDLLSVAQRQWTDLVVSLGEYGVDWRKSRFAAYLKVVDELVALEEQRKTDPDAYRSFRRDTGKQQLLFEGMSQILQLHMASKVWDRFDRGILKRKLKKICAGGPLPRPQTGDRDAADEARDTLVELHAAALLADWGFDPSLTAADEDLRLRLVGRDDVFAECKRPMGMRTLPTAISRLRQQCWQRTMGKRGVCVAVLAVERIHGYSGALRKAQTSQLVDAEVHRRVDLTIRKVRELCSRVPRCSLGTLAPVGLVTFSGAVLVDNPVTHVYRFTYALPFDTGDTSNTPEWLVEQFRTRTGLLGEFTD
jgi:hypothetical protein